MRWAASLLLISGFALAACGGSTTQDGSPTGGSAGSAGIGGAGAGGGGGASGGSAGAGATAGAGGAAGASCCSPGATYDCGSWGDELQCVNGVCKEPPPPGLCWSDQDCGVGSVCLGGFVCPCAADCAGPDQMGKCSAQPGCCATDSDCTQKPNVPMVCVGGNCEPKPPPGKCWSDQDCPMGASCGGSCVCPCGVVCACGGVMGSCEGPPPPPSLCCSSPLECGPGAVCAKGVCEPLIPGACWTDQECPAGTKCSGASICPCGALCAVIDTPGKCL